MNQAKLTLTEIKYLKIFDRRDIRIRIERSSKNQSKWPLIENWTKYYSEPWTITEMLEKDYNWGIRTGKKVGNYYHLVIDIDSIWAKEIINDVRYIETKKGIHRYLLIKELPKSCWLVNKYGDKVGEIHSLGRQVVGIGSIHELGTRYTLKGRMNVKFSLHFEKLTELQAFLTERNIFTTPWGKKGLENIRDLKIYQPKAKKTTPQSNFYQQKQELEAKIKQHPKAKELNICYTCLVYFKKEKEIIQTHLSGKRHQKNQIILQNRPKSNQILLKN